MAEVQRYYPVAVEKVPDALPTPPSPVPPPHSHTHTPSSLHTPSPSVRHEGKSKGKGKDKDDVGLHHVLTTVEQTLHLLLNIRYYSGTNTTPSAKLQWNLNSRGPSKIVHIKRNFTVSVAS